MSNRVMPLRETIAVECAKALNQPVGTALRKMRAIASKLPASQERSVVERIIRSLKTADDALDSLCRTTKPA